MYFLGIDFGTTGARACVIDANGVIAAEDARDFGEPPDDAQADVWRDALRDLVASLPVALRQRLSAIAIDGTSGTVLACDTALDPCHPPLLYADDRAAAEAALIRTIATPGHPAGAATSGLAKVLWLRKHLGPAGGACRFLNQADWLCALLSGRTGVTDYHNALKLGLDLDTLRWPAWIDRLADAGCLPTPIAPGTAFATLSPARARELGVNPECTVRAGTTDSIAAFLAAGASESGDAVTSLGSTLVLKLLSETRVESSEHGIYSHWFGRRWLAGGASNAGGAVLRQFFDDQALATLSERIDTAHESPLDYLPLPKAGERFPVNDPALMPRLAPRPADDAEFLHGLLESLARIEARGYALLARLGATPASRVQTAGGGARNAVWTRIRERHLGIPVSPAAHTQAAYGSARLARDGLTLFQPRD